MSTEEEVATERVERGAAWLDEKVPEWYLRIDVAALDLSDTCRCVLGQLWAEAEKVLNGEYSSGYSCAIDEHCRFGDASWPRLHGFERSQGRREDGSLFEVRYEDLDEAWIKAIKDRCNAGVLA
jgi:hypothetical protein